MPKECPACSYLKPAGVHKCPSCGFAPERQSRIEATDGDLVPLSGKRKAGISGHSQQQVYSMLIAVAQSRGYASGYPAAKFMSRYGHWPKGLTALPIERDAAFLGWLRSESIRWAKGRAKREAARAVGKHDARQSLSTSAWSMARHPGCTWCAVKVAAQCSWAMSTSGLRRQGPFQV